MINWPLATDKQINCVARRLPGGSARSRLSQHALLSLLSPPINLTLAVTLLIGLLLLLLLVSHPHYFFLSLLAAALDP